MTFRVGAYGQYAPYVIPASPYVIPSKAGIYPYEVVYVYIFSRKKDWKF